LTARNLRNPSVSLTYPFAPVTFDVSPHLPKDPLARTVLLADDSVTAQNMGRRILMDAGYEVITVNNGSAALKKVHESPPDLIVLDVYMPGYGGLEVCQRLKESRETMKIPVLLSVGKMEPFKPEEAKRVRADAHIIKPFDAGELLAALTKLEDRIVPAAEKRGKGSKKGRGKNDESETPEVPSDWSEKIAHLAETKKRHAEHPVAERPSAEQLEIPVPQVETFVEQVEAITAQAQAAASASAAEQKAVAEKTAASPEAQTANAPLEEADPQQEKPEELAVASAVEETVQNSEPVEVSAPVAQEPASDPQPAVVEAEVSAPAQEFAVETGPVENTEETVSAATPELVAEALPELVAEAAAPLPEAAPEPVLEAVAAATEKRSRWVAEPVPVSAEEAALALDQEMRQASASAEAVSAQPVSLTELVSDYVGDPAPPANDPDPEERSSGAAFAAAASAAGAAQAEAAAASPAAESQPQNEEAPEPSVPSETIAAWENWQHIRHSVMGSQQTEAIAESVAQVAQAAMAATPEASASNSAEQQKPNEPSPAPALDGAVLANIVDSVLAELKPKLMEEIAKKLAK
jgi:CheY-like chemotaxis protein